MTDNWEQFNEQAVNHLRQGQYQQALDSAQAAFNIARDAKPPLRKKMAISLNNIGQMHYSLGEMDKAEDNLKQSLTIFERKPPIRSIRMLPTR